MTVLTSREIARRVKLMPNGIPKWVRIYDDDGGALDRYTVVFSGAYNSIGRNKRGAIRRGSHPYVGMSASPYHPQGFCQHGDSDRLIDVNKSGFAPAIGRRNYLGKRINFCDLPSDCQKVVLSDYKELWELE